MKSDCMAKRVSADGWMFTVTLMLVFVGLVMVFSASAVMAKERYGSGYTFLIRQLIWAVAGIVAMVVAMRLDYRRYKHPAVVFSVLGITTLLLISVFFLDRAHNTHRWIHWGGFSLQPSELAKPALILFLAYFLENISNWLRLAASNARQKGIARFYIQLYRCYAGTILTAVVLLFHEQVQLVQAPHNGTVLLLIIRKGFA